MTENEIEGEATDEETPGLPVKYVVRAPAVPPAPPELTVDEVVEQANKVIEVMDRAMTRDHHYGVIQGTSKPTLLKPGAEKLCLLFRLAPSYDLTREYQGDHLTVNCTCSLTHIPSGRFYGQGVGVCTSREKKYAYRQGGQTCPACGKPGTVVRSSKKSAYFCIRDKGGCGERFAFGSEMARAIDQQDTKPVTNPDLPDTYNTIVKMAKKRALVDAVLTVTAASDVFTQDVEDAAPEAPAGQYVEAGPYDAPEPAHAPPKGWKDLASRFAEVLRSDTEEAGVWINQAFAAVCGENMTFADATYQQRVDVGAALSQAVFRMEQMADEGELATGIGTGAGAVGMPTRAAIQAVLGEHLGGVVLEGPSWAMTEEEEIKRGMLTREVWVVQHPVATVGQEEMATELEETGEPDAAEGIEF